MALLEPKIKGEGERELLASSPLFPLPRSMNIMFSFWAEIVASGNDDVGEDDEEDGEAREAESPDSGGGGNLTFASACSKKAALDST